jgi:hypothetical protein
MAANEVRRARGAAPQCEELLRAALRFARVTNERKGRGEHRCTREELFRAALRFARVTKDAQRRAKLRRTCEDLLRAAAPFFCADA